jgi:hypothetical protein
MFHVISFFVSFSLLKLNAIFDSHLENKTKYKTSAFLVVTIFAATRDMLLSWYMRIDYIIDRPTFSSSRNVVDSVIQITAKFKLSHVFS